MRGAAGITDRLWSIEGIVAKIDAMARPPSARSFWEVWCPSSARDRWEGDT